jgi:hypothetical protein|tara:strand:- start:756 stop:962 length:207 start_codon:yes stop_codon:yes gene_type:complete
MTFSELDRRIRAGVSDEVERKHILEGLHGIEEAVNQCASFWLNASGYTIDEEKIYRKEERPTLFQVNI